MGLSLQDHAYVIYVIELEPIGWFDEFHDSEGMTDEEL